MTIYIFFLTSFFVTAQAMFELVNPQMHALDRKNIKCVLDNLEQQSQIHILRLLESYQKFKPSYFHITRTLEMQREQDLRYKVKLLSQFYDTYVDPKFYLTIQWEMFAYDIPMKLTADQLLGLICKAYRDVQEKVSKVDTVMYRTVLAKYWYEALCNARHEILSGIFLY